MAEYLPEGELYCREDNKIYIGSRKALEECKELGRIVEAPCIVCDNAHNLIVDFGFIKGVIPRIDGAVGIGSGATRDIALISRVNKPVCFKVVGFRKDDWNREQAVLSRRAAQEEAYAGYISRLSTGDVIRVKITHMEHFGAFVDIGCGLPSLIPIDAVSVSRISHPADRFYIGQSVLAAVKNIEQNKITLSHKELLGTWMENAANFIIGETVAGIVRTVEPYGIFIELTPNLAGLAEPQPGIKPGQQTSVYIKSIIPDKMKIKLIIVDAFDTGYVNHSYDYYINGGRIDKWTYSPATAAKLIETVF
ncbi:MAG: S1 RNA-binding domain-containing protein [Oscillospiraceae bacterium]|jgi:small subunit ribosomal protein S1|nr:S1 RNA-binding domain-containing protein [Oscillospiraceae bacterium]